MNVYLALASKSLQLRSESFWSAKSSYEAIQQIIQPIGHTKFAVGEKGIARAQKLFKSDLIIPKGDDTFKTFPRTNTKYKLFLKKYSIEDIETELNNSYKDILALNPEMKHYQTMLKRINQHYSTLDYKQKYLYKLTHFVYIPSS